MATLQRIRNHGLFLLIIVGLAMLAFILGDALNSGSSFMNKSREYIGEIEGQKIHYTEYESAVEQLTEVYKIESGRSDFDEDMHAQIRNQVWQMMVAKYTLQSEAEKIGMDVTADELYELCAGSTPHHLTPYVCGTEWSVRPQLSAQFPFLNRDGYREPRAAG